MKILIIGLYFTGLLSGCSSTSTPITSVDQLNSSVKSVYNNYKYRKYKHKAIAMAKFRGQWFIGETVGLESREEAELEAIRLCQKDAS
jgi:uncharacterized protein YceK